MKNLVKIVFIIIVVFLIQCNKIPFDYRNKFTGDYEFTVVVKGFPINCCFWDDPCCGADTVINFKGKIYLGASNDKIIIQYINKEDYIFSTFSLINNNSDATTDDNGRLIIKVSEEGIMKNIGNFDKKGSLNFIISWGASSHTVTGKKI